MDVINWGSTVSHWFFELACQFAPDGPHDNSQPKFRRQNTPMVAAASEVRRPSSLQPCAARSCIDCKDACSVGILSAGLGPGDEKAEKGCDTEYLPGVGVDVSASDHRQRLGSTGPAASPRCTCIFEPCSSSLPLDPPRISRNPSQEAAKAVGPQHPERGQNKTSTLGNLGGVAGAIPRPW